MSFKSTGVINMRHFAEEENGFIIPSTYTQLEYIESTGTQYIDTGYY
jgi:hypothetical protein